MSNKNRRLANEVPAEIDATVDKDGHVIEDEKQEQESKSTNPVKEFVNAIPKPVKKGIKWGLLGLALAAVYKLGKASAESSPALLTGDSYDDDYGADDYTDTDSVTEV